jgi:fused signal recognition particle receptor
MFDKLKSAFSSLSQLATQKSLSGKNLEDALWNLELALLEGDVAQEVASAITNTLKTELENTKIPRSTDVGEYVKKKIRESILNVFARTPRIDVLGSIESNRRGGVPYVVVFLGINGTGKTTSIAKFANMLKKRNLTAVIAAGDTHRAGAIEQLSLHAERLGVKVIAQAYGADPAAVARDAKLYAQSHRTDAVLVDTAGRIQTSKNLMEEMSKIIRVVNPNMKIFVGDALAGNDVVSQAKEFTDFTSFDGAILTKADADVKGGAALSIAYITGRPILYLGTGQGYDDLVPFDPEKFAESVVP